MTARPYSSVMFRFIRHTPALHKENHLPVRPTTFDTARYTFETCKSAFATRENTFERLGRLDSGLAFPDLDGFDRGSDSGGFGRITGSRKRNQPTQPPFDTGPHPQVAMHANYHTDKAFKMRKVYKYYTGGG
jgi:hypothetical protein